MEQQLATEIHTSARKYYRLLCLHVARYLSYLGRTMEPYATQNEILSLVKPTRAEFMILHLPCHGGKRICPIYKFTSVEGRYVAYIGHLQRELGNVKRFYSYYHHSAPCDRFEVAVALPRSGDKQRDLALADLVASNWVAQKIELNYVDPLKEYLTVVLDKESDEFMDVFVELDQSPSLSEPTFEDVMTLWIAVLIWCLQLLSNGLIHRRAATRLTGKIYALIQNE